MHSQPFVIYAFLLTAGISLAGGVQALLTRFSGRLGKLYSAFALMCFGAAGFQLASAAYYLAETVPAAVAALHWQMLFLCALIVPMYLFVALQSRVPRVNRGAAILVAIALALFLYDQLQPYGIRFAAVELAAPMHLPWGEELGHVAGRPGTVFTRVVFVGTFWAILGWGTVHAIRQYRAGYARAAAYYAASLVMISLSAIWGTLIDYGVIRSFYIVGFAFQALVLLMALALGKQQARTVVDLREERVRLRAAQRQLEEALSTLREERDRLQVTREQLQQGETRMRLVLKGSNDAWWDWVIDSGEQYYSARGWEMLGYADQELVPYDDTLWDRLIFAEDREFGRKAIMDAVQNGADSYRFEMRMRHRDGHAVPVLCRGFIQRDAQGRAVRVSGTDMDLTAQKEAEANIHRLAYFDELTGLPNRRLLLDRLGKSLHAAQRSGQYGAVLYLDLDNFKHLNDARGHALGDQLLRGVALRITALLRNGDTVARLGGDEFVVVVNLLGDALESAADAAMAVAEKVRSTLEEPAEIDGNAYSGTVSIGLTLFPKAGDAIDNLLREADTAMYRAKSAGRNRISFFEAAMQVQAQERLALEQDLKEAVEAGAMAVHVQPQFDAAGRQVGGELLLRWNHARRGMVSPATFIPLAESSGLILKLGDTVVRRACEALAQLDIAGCTIPLAVNISPRQFRQEDFVARTQDALHDTGAPASLLVFEVTEGLFIDNWEEVAAKMSELTAMGIRFSIDDFGTGYSSLAYLKKLPLHEIKIDKQFVQNTPVDANDRAIVRSIFAVAKAFKLRVVAEGVETRAQAEFLAKLHCDGFQGFLYARPEPLEGWLARQRVLSHHD